MMNPARPLALIRRHDVLVALSLLAIIVVPVVARAAGHAEARRNVFAGLHRPAVHVTQSLAHTPHGQHAHGRHVYVHEHSRGEDRFRWSLHDGEFRSNCGVSTEELRDVIEALGSSGAFLWISQDGDEWVIRDRALIQRARGSVEPMQRLGKEMGRLGAQQGRFGAEMGRLGARQGVLAVRLAVLELRDEDDPAIEREAAAIEREMDELSRQQDELGERQDTSVEGRMDDLGEQMDRLGDQMEQLSQRAERELRALAKEAIASRRAERFGGRAGL